MTENVTILTYLTFGAIAIMVILYAWEKFSVELVSVAVLVGWLVLFWVVPALMGVESPLGPKDLLAGLSNEALITVLALLVVGQGLYHTDALQRPTAMLARVGSGDSTGVITLILMASLLVSAIVNDTPVVVMFLPILTAIAAGRGMAASKVLMGLSFAAQLGGMTTLIGTSTNLLVAGVSRESGGPDIGFFDFTVPAGLMAIVGFFYVAFIMPKLLRDRGSMAQRLTRGSGKQFIAQIDISQGHPLVGATAKAGFFADLKDMTVRIVQRREWTFLPPFEDVTLRPGDSVIVAATRAALTDVLTSGAPAPTPSQDGVDFDPVSSIKDLTLAETVVAPGSRLIGRTVRQASVYHDTETFVLGVERRSRMPRMPLSQIRLEAGDVLLMGGSTAAIEDLRADRDLLLMEWSASAVPRRRYARRALLIFLVFVTYAASGIGPVATGALAAAFAMIASGCLNSRQATRALDFRIYLMVGAALAAAAALQATGGALLIADLAVTAAAGQPAWIILSMLFLIVAVMTNFLSNNATAVLFTPIALSMADKTGYDALPFVVAVMLGASCAFATPIGYQTNMLVMGPGHYRFSDFLVAGTPLVILMWIVFSFVAPWYYF